MSLVKTSEQNRVDTGFGPGCSRLCLTGSWKTLRTGIPPPMLVLYQCLFILIVRDLFLLFGQNSQLIIIFPFPSAMQYHELPDCACLLTSFKVLEGCQKSFFTYPKPSLLLAKQATIPQPLIVQNVQTQPLPLYGSSMLEHVPWSSRKGRISIEASTYIPRKVPSRACRSTQTNPLEAFPQLPGCNTGLQQQENWGTYSPAV